MTIAVVAILGHFSKTVLLFLIPQVGNFVYGLPQLFRLVPCPRHRLPKFNADTGLVETSCVVYDPKKIGKLGKLCLAVFRAFRVVRVDEDVTDFAPSELGEGEKLEG
jgi:UDP-N-acetylglucosamine--dolichyl-phosphate N-acetylglucosaminephosphotransferase